MFLHILLIGLLALPSPAGAEPLSPTVEAREDALLARVAERDPAYHQRLLALRERDPEAYAVHLARVARLADRYDEDPVFAARVDQIQALEDDLRATAQRWKVAAPADRPALMVQMTELGGRVFELKQAERRQRIAEYQARLNQLEAEVSALQAERDAAIAAWIRDAVR